jgi:hypothetical protein
MQDTTKLQSLLADASKSAAGSKPPFDALHARLKAEYQAAGAAWNARVEALREAWITEQTALDTHPAGVDKRFLRGHLRLAHAAVWKRYADAHYFFPSYQFPEEEELCRNVGHFIEHGARHEVALGLS